MSEVRSSNAAKDGLTARTASALMEMRVSLSWLVEDWIPEGGLALLYGPPGIGKSFVALDLALSIAAGHPWPDPKAAKPKTSHPVLYWAGEGEYGYGLRLRAWLHIHNLHVKDLGDRFEMLESRDYDLSRLNDRQLDAIERQLELRRERNGATPLLVVDTIAALSPSLDENKAEAVGALIAACKRLIAGSERPKATILLVHHTGKMSLNGPRGHSRFTGDPDVVIRMQSVEAKNAKNECARVRLTVDKQRNAEAPPQLVMRLERVKFGKDTALAPCIAPAAPESGSLPAQIASSTPPSEIDASAKELLSILHVLSRSSQKITPRMITGYIKEEYRESKNAPAEEITANETKKVRPRGLSKNNIPAVLERLKRANRIKLRNGVAILLQPPEPNLKW